VVVVDLVEKDEADDQEVGISTGTDAAIKGNEQLLEATHIPQNMVLYWLLCAGKIFIAGANFSRSRKVKSRRKKLLALWRNLRLDLRTRSFQKISHL